MNDEIDTEYYTYLDHKQIVLKDGFVIKDEMNETLDSGTIQFVSVGGEIGIEPFDSIVFDRTATIPNFKRKKQLVDTYVGDICCFNSTLDNSDYEYTITTFSETKILERFPCPNLAITSPAHSVATYIKEYCRRYVPYIYIYDNEDEEVKLVPCLKLDPAVLTKFTMTCPEFVWNTPTLREVLTDLFSVADCIPIVKDNVLTYIDLNEKGNPIDTTKLTNRQVSGTSADYCDSLTVPMKNILSNQVIRKNERISLRSNQGEINTGNACFITSKPIYKIRKFKLYMDWKISGDIVNTEFYDCLDLVNSSHSYGIKEKKEYEALGIQDSYSLTELKNKEFLNQQKPFNIYFTRGSNIIEGLGANFKLKFHNSIHTTHYSFGMLGFYTTNQDIIGWGDNVFSGIDGGFVDGGLLNIFAEIEYDTIEETTINVSRKNPIKNMQNSLFDTQTANSVDLEHQTLFEYAKINRLSSKIRMIEGVYFDEADIPQLSDYIGEKILFSREISYYDNIILFKGYIVDNYVLKDYFTGVKSKARSWNIADTDEAINRDDFYKVFIKFGKKAIQAPELPYFKIYSTFSYWDFIKFRTTTAEKVDLNHILCRTFWNNNQYPDPHIITESELLSGLQPIACVMESTKTDYVNSIAFNVRFNDNFKFGDIAIPSDDLKLSKSVRYVNDSGRFSKMQIFLKDKIDEGITYYIPPIIDINLDMDDLIEKLTDEDTFNSAYRQNALLLTNYRPLIFRDEKWTKEMSFEMKFEKDNREIIGSSIQFDYISDDEDIIVNEGFIRFVPVGSNPAAPTGIYVARNHHYKKGDKVPVGEFIQCQLDFDEYNVTGMIRVPYSVASIGPNDSWAVSDKLFVNGLQEIYANFCYIRDENVYNNQIDKIKIGTIFDDTETLQAKSEEVGQYVTKVYSLNREINIADCVDFLYDDEIE